MKKIKLLDDYYHPDSKIKKGCIMVKGLHDIPNLYRKLRDTVRDDWWWLEGSEPDSNDYIFKDNLRSFEKINKEVQNES